MATAIDRLKLSRRWYYWDAWRWTGSEWERLKYAYLFGGNADALILGPEFARDVFPEARLVRCFRIEEDEWVSCDV